MPSPCPQYTVTGAGISDANGTYDIVDGEVQEGAYVYTNGTYWIRKFTGNWKFMPTLSSPGLNIYYAGSSGTEPPTAGWVANGVENEPVPTVTGCPAPTPTPTPTPSPTPADPYAPWGGFANWQRLRLLEYV